MIPYFKVDTIPFINSDSFSFFFFLAFVCGYLFGALRCKEKGLSFSEINEFFCFTFIPACFGAHFFHVLFYKPGNLIQDPSIFFRLNAGLASMGGVLSYLLFFILFIKIKKSPLNWKGWLDIAAQGFIVGLLVGRIGCTLVHDHLGAETNFILGIQFESGVIRHDLGFYELLYLSFVILPLSLYAHKKIKLDGIQAALFALLYAPARLLFDSLRMGELRYQGFTPAQLACIVLFMCGISILLLSKRAANAV